MTAHAHSPSPIRLDSTPSTNTYLSTRPDIATLPHGTVVTTRCQSCGRGQRGNTWEAEPGLNITMSMLLRPHGLAARDQFVVSEIVSVATVEFTRQHVADAGEVMVKWPNDIYVDNRKICGILIENSLSGTAINRSIAGIGLNVNQTVFRSDAPNPVSLTQLTGQKYDVDELASSLTRRIIDTMSRYLSPHMRPQLHKRYMEMLWRRGELRPYRDTATGNDFAARLSDVDPDGHLHLIDDTGTEHTYAFKEVSFII